MTEWLFSEENAQLMRPARVAKLTSKAAAVFACLQRNKGQIVSIEQFLKEVWSDAHVTPDLVREYIHDIRDALNDDARNPRFIETVRGKGFRLIGDIDLAPSDLALTPTESRSARLPTLAILRAHPTDNPTCDRIAREVVSEVTNHLARFHYIGLIARESTFHAAEAADIRALASDVDAKYLLETDYTCWDRTIRARVQLLDARNGQALWGTRLDFSDSQPLSIIDDVTETIVMALTGWHGELHRAEYKSVLHKEHASLNAFDHFILGCDLEMRLDAENISKSVFHLEFSVKLDPTFARAWLVLALTLRWAFAVLPGRDKSYLQRSERAFLTALNLAPTDPVNLALMAVNAARQGNMAASVRMLERAEAGMRGDSDAQVCTATAMAVITGDTAEALALFSSVLKKNSATPSWVHFAEACIAFAAADYARCISAFRSSPKEISASVFCCLSYAMLGDHEKAKRMKEAIFSGHPNFDFHRFARNFPLAHETVRAQFDTAVAELDMIA